jgi:S1-C subfamily serine protease
VRKIFIPLALFLLSACAARQPAKRATPLSEYQRRATVAISVACVDAEGEVSAWRGSGVIVGTHTIITAHHVVDCAGIYIATVETLAGELLNATVVDFDADSDVANIVTDGPLPEFRFHLGALPEIGEIVCSESAIPTRARKCGEVVHSSSEQSAMDIRFMANVVGGNSGSGLYNDRGHLIGVVTRRNLDSTMGAAGSLWGFPGLMEPR